MVKKRNRAASGATADQILLVIDGFTSSQLRTYSHRAAKRGLSLSRLVAERIHDGVFEAVDAKLYVPKDLNLEGVHQDHSNEGQPGRDKDGGVSTPKRALENGMSLVGIKKRKKNRRSNGSTREDCMSSGEAAQVRQNRGQIVAQAGTQKAQNGEHAIDETDEMARSDHGNTTAAITEAMIGQDSVLSPSTVACGQSLHPHSCLRAEDIKSQEDTATQSSPSNQLMRQEDDTSKDTDAASDDYPDVPSTQDWQGWTESPHGKIALSFESPAKQSFKHDSFVQQDDVVAPASSHDTFSKTWTNECCTQHSPCPPRWQVSKSSLVGKKYYAVRRGRKLGIYYRWDKDDGAEAQVKGFKGSLYQGFTTAEEAERFMNSPLVAGCYRSTLCDECGDVCGEYSKSSICAACATKQISELHGLCEEQKSVLDLVSKGHNVFFTGAAGTGKSTTLVAIMRFLDRVGRNSRAVASTGIAALLLGGSTIHVFAGWNVKAAKELSLWEMRHNARGKKNRERLIAPDVLIIDEISMVENSMFARLDAVLREVRNQHMPLGGVQLIVSGDFHQLPPVRPFETCLECGTTLEGWAEGLSEYTCTRAHGTWHDHEKWAFESEAWKQCGFVYRQLVQTHRQANMAFVTLLNRLRKGDLTEEEEAVLIDHEIDFDPSEAVQIYPFRWKVDHINDGKLAALLGPAQTYHCVDGCDWNSGLHPELKDRFIRIDDKPNASFRYYHDERHRFCESLELKKDMPVLLLANLGIREGLVNGTRGKVIDFRPVHPAQLPHKSKSSKDRDFSSGLILGGEHAVHQEHEIRRFAKRTLERASGGPACWPVVEFENGVTRTIYPHCEVAELGQEKPYSLMSRTQIPLVAGWAITIHKSQGMTISQAVVDADRSWEYGQSYVAMSRVKSLNGLLVQGLASGKAMKADPTVMKFMDETFGKAEERAA